MIDYEALLDIRHLSPSSLSRFQNDRASWVAGYLYKIWGDMGPAVWRGKAVEAGFSQMIRTSSSDADPEQVALDLFELEAQGEINDKCDKERENIPAMLEELKQYAPQFGEVTASQLKVDLWFDGAPLPVIGYPDYVFKDHCVDLKTTLRMPSEPKPDHVLQASFYALARGETKAGLLYVTPKKSRIDWLTEEQIQSSHDILRGRAVAVGECIKAAMLLSVSEGIDIKEAMARMNPPDFNSFYWDLDTAFKAIDMIPAWSDFKPMADAA